MSARNKGDAAPPHPLGQCFTSVKVARAVCRWLASQGIHPQQIVEPSAGVGAFCVAAKAQWPTAQQVAVEIDPALAWPLLGALRKQPRAPVLCGPQFDFLKLSRENFPDGVDLVLGNPPYSVATGRLNAKGKPIMRSEWENFVAHARALFPSATIAFLLRVGALGGAHHSRRGFWRDHPVTNYAVLAPRPSFQANGAVDSTEYAVYVWQPGRPRAIYHILTEESESTNHETDPPDWSGA